MKLTLGRRVAIVMGGWLALGLALWAYVSTHDVMRPVRDFLAGRPVVWPPPPTRRGGDAGGAEQAVDLVGDLAASVRPVALGALGIAMIIAALRLRQRRARAAAIVTWELRLGRDDLASPYRVQEAMEGIVGAVSARWYERAWRGQDHLAFETHRLPDGSITFTVAAPRQIGAAIRGGVEDLYPDVELVATAGRPSWADHVVRLKKRRPFVLSLQTNRNYDHAFSEALVSLLASSDGEISVQLVLTPGPGWLHRRARGLMKRRERTLNQQDRRDPLDPGMDSFVEAKELKGALETQHRSLVWFDLRVAGRHAASVRRVAGLFAQLRSENQLAPREMRLRCALYSRRLERALPNPLPSWRTGALSTSELATVWQLPRARAKHAPIARSTVRRSVAPPEIERDEVRALMRDEHGPVSIAADDRKYGHALIGGQGVGKSSVMARHFYADARDSGRAVILIDPKGPLAELCRGMVPADRIAHYLDLGHPEIGFNPLTIEASAGARAAVFMQALLEANPPGSIQAASDSFLRQAVAAVCAVEARPTLWHVYRLLDFNDGAYREYVVDRLDQLEGVDFARSYWKREFPALLSDRGFAAQALNPPRNKLERLISTPDIDLLLRHPTRLNLEGVLTRGEILIVAGAKAAVGEDNTVLVTQLLMQLLHRAIQARQGLPESARRRVSLLVDEAHNVLTPSVARLLAEGRSAGLDAVFAWQYSAQIRDEVVRSGVRSLLQSLSIFRMREMEDARSLAGLAMEVYTDRISVDREEQERLRFSPDDIVKLPIHQAINLWIAAGVPRSGYEAASLPMESLYDEELAGHHIHAQRERGGCRPVSLAAPVIGHLDSAPATPPPAKRQPRRDREPAKPSERSRGALDLPGDIGSGSDGLHDPED